MTEEQLEQLQECMSTIEILTRRIEALEQDVAILVDEVGISLDI